MMRYWKTTIALSDRCFNMSPLEGAIALSRGQWVNSSFLSKKGSRPYRPTGEAKPPILDRTVPLSPARIRASWDNPIRKSVLVMWVQANHCPVLPGPRVFAS